MSDERDPWKAVHRIKLRHEKVVEAAVTVINCTKWHGERQAQFLAEAVNELEKAVIELGYTQPPSTSNPPSGRGVRG